MFVDSDVEVACRCPATARPNRLVADPPIAATFGSYDDHPDGAAAPQLCTPICDITARIKQTRARRRPFWRGWARFRREAFLAIGGYDEGFSHTIHRRYRTGESRLRKAGHQIHTIPAAQGKHLKDWTLSQLWRTDVFGRALPWSQLMMEGNGPRGKIERSEGSEGRGGAWPCLMALTAWLGMFHDLIDGG